MGHMNVMWYVGKFDEATWQVFGLMGLTRTFLRENNRGMAGLQQNIAYRRELYAGDIITIRSGILEIREKTVRFFHEMKNEETDVVAAITVLVAAYIDTAARKATPFPEEVLARGRDMIVDYDPGI